MQRLSKRGTVFAVEKNIDTFQPYVNKVVDFLTNFFESGIYYISTYMVQTALSHCHSELLC